MGVPRTITKNKMVLVSIHIPKQMLEEINDLVYQGKYPSVSEFIRYAIRDLLNRTHAILASHEITVDPQPQSQTPSQPQLQSQSQPRETHQAQQQQHVYTGLSSVDLDTDMKLARREPSIEAIEHVIERLIEWAKMERKSEEMTKRYRECIAKLVDAILSNLGDLRFNVKQEDETYKISRKIIREFLEDDCDLPKGMVAAAYGAMAEEFDKRGFIMMRTPTAIILKKRQATKEVVRNV